jgi:capsular polysaccharide biosynthesis protein
MELSNLLRQKKNTLVSIFLIFLILGAVFIFLQDFKFSSKSKVLVVQEGYGRVDPYAVSRSVEYLSDLFSRVTYSNSFFMMVMDSNFEFDRSYFGSDSVKQMKTWEKTLGVKTVENSGIINVSVFHPDARQAKQINLAVNQVLINNNQNYQGLGDSVKISVIDQPVVSKYPVKPNLILNFFFIVGLSLVFGLMYIYLFPEEKYDINLFGKKKKIRSTKKINTNYKPSREDAVVDSSFEDDQEDIDEAGDIRNILE